MRAKLCMRKQPMPPKQPISCVYQKTEARRKDPCVTPQRRLIVRHLSGMVAFLINAWLSQHSMNVSKTLDSYVICIFICTYKYLFL